MNPASRDGAAALDDVRAFIKDQTDSLHSAFYLSGGLLLGVVVLSRFLKRPTGV